MSKLHFYDKTRRPWPNERLATASIVGHTTDTSTRIWVRACLPVPGVGYYDPQTDEPVFWLVVSKDPIPTDGIPKAKKQVGGSVPVLIANGFEIAIDHVFFGAKSLTFATDITGVFDVPNLQPGTRYHYALFTGFERIQRWEFGDEEQASFETLPASPHAITFGLFSCHMPFRKKKAAVSMHMWAHLLDRLQSAEANYLIGCGDQVYSDGGSDNQDIWAWLKKHQANPKLSDDDMVSWYRDIYRGYWGFDEIKRVFETFPTYMIWDDHEIRDGWGSLTKKERAQSLGWASTIKEKASALALQDRMFKAAKKVYDEYQHSHNPDTGPDQAIRDYSFSAGPVATYVWDMRGHRNFDGDAGHLILGREQAQRFTDWLKGLQKNPPKILFVVSPVPVVHFTSGLVDSWILNRLGTKDDLRDEWEHAKNHAERNDLLHVLAKFSHKKGVPVVFLSGDVHLGASFALKDRDHPNARIYQVTSSGITYSGRARVPDLPTNLDSRVADSIVARSGCLPGSGERWTFERLAVTHKRNFAIVTCHLGSGVPRVVVEMFADAGTEDGVLVLPRIVLT